MLSSDEHDEREMGGDEREEVDAHVDAGEADGEGLRLDLGAVLVAALGDAARGGLRDEPLLDEVGEPGRAERLGEGRARDRGGGARGLARGGDGAGHAERGRGAVGGGLEVGRLCGGGGGGGARCGGGFGLARAAVGAATLGLALLGGLLRRRGRHGGLLVEKSEERERDEAQSTRRVSPPLSPAALP